MSTIPNPWKSLEIKRNRWKSKEITGNQEKSLEIIGNYWKSKEITVNQEKSLEIKGKHWKSAEIKGNQKIKKSLSSPLDQSLIPPQSRIMKVQHSDSLLLCLVYEIDVSYSFTNGRIRYCSKIFNMTCLTC